MPDPDTFAARLRAIRTGAGLTQQQLADRAGMSAARVGNLERGQRADPQLSTLTRLADALGVSLDRLAGRKP